MAADKRDTKRPGGPRDTGQAAIAAALSHALALPDPFRPFGAPPPGLVPRNIQPDPPASRHSADFLLERALTCSAMGMQDTAIDDLRDAVKLRPSLRPAWRKLHELLTAAGDSAGAEHAAGQIAAAPTDMPPRPQKPMSTGRLEQNERAVAQMIAHGAPRPPEALLRSHLFATPTDAAALYALAGHTTAQRDHEATALLLQRALELAPNYLKARRDYAILLLDQAKPGQALHQLDQALREFPGDELCLRYRAAALAAIGDDDASLAIYESIIQRRAVKETQFWTNYARRLHYAGRRAECVAAYRTCIRLAPTNGEAYWGIANLKYETLSEGDIAAIYLQLENPHLTSTDRFHFHYTLGHVFEKQGNHAKSFEHYAAGAAVRRDDLIARGEGYNSELNTKRVARTKEFFSRALLDERAGWGHPSAAPIFVLGMPRSGSTLVEQILASHSAIEGTQELPDIGHIAHALGSGRHAEATYPHTMRHLTAAQLTALGEQYLDSTKIYRKTGRPFYIDKMPYNWINAGLILLILPNAKIIDTRRDGMSCCFSVFKQVIARGAEFAFDLTDLGRFYNDYVDLMAHFDSVLPGRIHRVDYGRMVDDTETEIRRLLAYCGVPFQEQCLRFWETRRSVATPSSEQVRRPIFRDALDQWRNYDAWLGPLKAELGVIPTDIESNSPT